jgi:putative membrane protein
MVFVDLLTSQLFGIGFAGLLVAYLFVDSYLLSKRGKKIGESIRYAAIPIAALGVYLLLTSLFGQFAWPLPGSYNILFFEPLSFAAFLLLAFVWAVRSGSATSPVGLLGLLLGIITIYYGYEGYLLNMTQSPIAMFGMYALLGIAGVFSYPATIALDQLVSGTRRLESKYFILCAIFVVALVLGSLIAIGTGVMAVPAHLASPP